MSCVFVLWSELYPSATSQPATGVKDSDHEHFPQDFLQFQQIVFEGSASICALLILVVCCSIVVCPLIKKYCVDMFSYVVGSLFIVCKF